MWDTLWTVFDSIVFHCLTGLLSGLLLIVLGIVYHSKIPTGLFAMLILIGSILTLYGGIWLVFGICMSTF